MATRSILIFFALMILPGCDRPPDVFIECVGCMGGYNCRVKNLSGITGNACWAIVAECSGAGFLVALCVEIPNGKGACSTRFVSVAGSIIEKCGSLTGISIRNITITPAKYLKIGTAKESAWIMIDAIGSTAARSPAKSQKVVNAGV